MTRQEHLFTIAMEECNEVAQRLSKALRFGIEDRQYEDGRPHGTNRERIINEYNDLVAAMGLAGFPPEVLSQPQMINKMRKIETYLKYAAKQGTLIQE